MLKLVLEFYIWKQHIENKAKHRWYYSHLPRPVAHGFTLAEILVTLTMIGVIAALTIPSLVNNINNATYVTQLKKTYATLQQAYSLVVADAGGSVFNTDFSSTTDDTAADRNAMNSFATKLNVVKNCGSDMGCWYTSPRKYLGGGIANLNIDLAWNNILGKAILADGTMMLVNINNTSCTYTPSPTPVGSPLYGTVCGYIYTDVNGANGPNQIGRDLFMFWITKTGIYPEGIFNDGRSCDINSTTTLTSEGCAGKVLTEGAMNY